MECTGYGSGEGFECVEVKKKPIDAVKSALTLDLKTSCFLQTTSDSSCVIADSPDLEHLLVPLQNDVSSSTPTTQILFPKLVTAEQEAYARGFIDALEELHKRQGMTYTESDLIQAKNKQGLEGCLKEASVLKMCSNESLHYTSMPEVQRSIASCGDSNHQLLPVIAMSSELAKSDLLQVVTTSDHVSKIPSYQLRLLSESIGETKPIMFQGKQVFSSTEANSNLLDLPKSANYSLGAVHSGSDCTTVIERVNEMKQYIVKTGMTDTCEQLQAAPCITSKSLPGIASDSVIEQKRARNRVAAQKCRMRKIERIEELTERVGELRSENERLSNLSVELSQQVADLKNQILLHVERGCRVLSGTVLIS